MPHKRLIFCGIRQKIHEHNQTLCNFLKTTKDEKLKELINNQKQDPIDANQAISTPINNIKNTPNFQSNNHNASVSISDSRQQRLDKTIPDDLPLTTDERSLLSKNLKSVPLRSTVNEFQVKHDAEEFFRCLRFKAHFQNRMVKPASNDYTSTLTSTDSCNDSIDFHFPSFDNYLDSSYSDKEDSFTSKLTKNLFPTKSGWTPPDARFSSLDLYIYTCRDQISKINFRSKLNYSKLTLAELTTIRSLRKRKDIIIKQADKGGFVVVWRRDLYLKEGLSQLENSPNSSLFFSKVKRNPINSFNKTIIITIKDEIEANNLPGNATSLVHLYPRAPTFDMLPKIHRQQTPIPGCPIVSSISCPTLQIAKFLDTTLSPFVEQQPTYIKDSNHAISIFSTFRFQGEHCFLFLMDIKLLYTSMPHEDGLIALRHFLDQRPDPELPINTLICLAELVLQKIFFSFNGSFYVQKSSVAMGSNLGRSFACLFVSYQEEKVFQSYEGPILEDFKRFVDDGIGAISMPCSDLERFISFVCNFHPTLQFEYQISSSCLSFLDIQLQITNNHINTSIFYKETDSHSYLYNDSSHSPKCITSIPFSELLCLRRICSNHDDFNTKANEMSTFFSNCNYSQNTIQSAINRISKISQAEALQPRPKQNTTKEDHLSSLTTHTCIE